MNESETRAELIDPKLKACGWGVVEGSKVLREYKITAGKIQTGGGRGRREIADYVLVYKGIKLAIIEAKSEVQEVGEGVMQAKKYAEKLQLETTYSSNGKSIYQICMKTGAEGLVADYLSPEALWNKTFPASSPKDDSAIVPAEVWREKFAHVPFEDKSGTWQLRNQQFFSLHALNEAVAEKMRRHNQTRMQEKPFSREERFLADEKPLLAPLPRESFEIKSYKEYKVRQNNHIKLSEDSHYYSVPYQYIGETVRVVYSRSMVRIYHRGNQVGAHARDRREGRYTTVANHLCSHHRHYLGRSPGYYLDKAKAVSPILHELIGKLFTRDRHPEQLYGNCDGLLDIYRKIGAEKADKACKIALEYQYYSYRFVRNVLDNNMVDQQSADPQKPLPGHGNVRGKEYYEKQLNINFEQ